jgi:hypothetical protein
VSAPPASALKLSEAGFTLTVGSGRGAKTPTPNPRVPPSTRLFAGSPGAPGPASGTRETTPHNATPRAVNPPLPPNPSFHCPNSHSIRADYFPPQAHNRDVPINGIILSSRLALASHERNERHRLFTIPQSWVPHPRHALVFVARVGYLSPQQSRSPGALHLFHHSPEIDHAAHPAPRR